MFTIMGAKSHIGFSLTQKILSAGKPVRILLRNHSNAKSLIQKGAELRSGNFMDQDYMRNAFADTRIVFVMIPINFFLPEFSQYLKKQVDIITNSIAANSVKFVVSLSSLGVQSNQRDGAISGFHYLEQQLDAMPDIHVLHLRPGYFMENFYAQVPIIRQYGIMAAPLRGDRPFSMIASMDVANYAARRMLILDFRDKHYQYLLGPKDRTMHEVVHVIGHAIGEPDLSFHQLPEETFVKAIVRAGISREKALKMDYYFKLMNRDALMHGIIRTRQNSTPTTLEQFSSKFAQLFFHSKG
ncbi:NAD(P)H-binding protein [candidate division KSB1 bacterium]|nr:NAD(P)H-binding protein [candidate division KSB1 bacterium]